MTYDVRNMLGTDMEGIRPFDATRGTIIRYTAWLGLQGTVAAESLQKYFSAMNKYFRDHQRPPVALLGELLADACRGLKQQQQRIEEEDIRVALPAPVDVVGIGSEWECEGIDDLELSPTTGSVPTAPERLVKHGTVARGAAYCLPCLVEAEAFNITDVDGGQPTSLLCKIPAGTLCRSRKHDAISRFIPHDVEAEKTVLRYKVFKNLVGAKDGISGKYTEWHVIDVGVLEALAYREGMKEYEASSATLRPFEASSLAHARSWSEYGKGTTVYIMKVVYNVVTVPTVRSSRHQEVAAHAAA
eukprot:jgi/Tetstr1/459767/TSEL_005120.t1